MHSTQNIYIKIPTGMVLKNRVLLNAYVMFLDLKAFNSEGRITKKDLNRRKADRQYYNRAMKRMISLGWATEVRGAYHLHSYPAVWRMMGIERFKFKQLKKLKFAYIKIDITTLPERRTDYLKHLRTEIEKHICDRHQKQMKYRLNNVKRSRRPTVNCEVEKPVYLSSARVANILGYKSHSAALDKREKYYPMSSEKSQLLKIVNAKGKPFFRMSCRTINL
jgi:signal recognition particle subunit SEC65